MSKEAREMIISIDGFSFECCKQSDGEWHCWGSLNDIKLSVRFPNSAPTHVFQHIENIVKNRI